MQGSIVINRPSQFLSASSSRALEVHIDGKDRGWLKYGTQFEVAVEPGEHSVAVSLDWVQSRPVHVIVQPGSKIELMIHRPSRFMWPTLLASVTIALLGVGLIELSRILTEFGEYAWQRSIIMIVVFAVGFWVIRRFFLHNWPIGVLGRCNPD
jgi:hypothetical protein